MENTLENARRFIYDLDDEFGESWSDVTETLAERFVEYANYVTKKEKDASVDGSKRD